MRSYRVILEVDIEIPEEEEELLEEKAYWDVAHLYGNWADINHIEIDSYIELDWANGS